MTDGLRYLTTLEGQLVAASRELHAGKASPRRPAARAAGLARRHPALSTTFALGGSAAAAAIVLSIVGLGTGAQNAFAGWTPAPTSPASGQTAAAQAACQAALPTSERIEAGRRGAAGDGVASPVTPRITTADWRPVIADSRGPFTVVVFETKDGDANGSCLVRLPAQPLSISAGFGGGAPAPVAAGEARVDSLGAGVVPSAGAPTAADPQYRRISGRTGAGVTAVHLVLTNGDHVTATVQDGHFLAWWPGKADATALQATSAAGTTTRHLYTPALHRP